MFSKRKAFIVVVMMMVVILITSLGTSNKGFSFYSYDTGYLSTDTMLVSKDGYNSYYACKGEVVIIKRVYNDNTCLVEVEGNTGLVDSDYVKESVTIPNLCQGDGVSKSIVEAVNERMLLIPEDLRSIFESSSWSIIATKDDLNKKYYESKYDFVSGSTSYENKTIYIANSMEAVNSATIHEFGHWVDWFLDFPSQKDKLISIYNKEQDNFYKAFNLAMHWDEREFFAEGFKRFFTDRLKLEQESPELYNYLSDILQDFSIE